MQVRQIVRTLAAAASIALVGAALMGASWYASEPQPPVTTRMSVGVPTGEYLNGVAVHRLPSITVTARRSDAQ